jgi:glycosyl transferase, family 25
MVRMKIGRISFSHYFCISMSNQRQQFFRQVNEKFDHVYVITLERAKERHDHIMKELEGLEYELFFGVDKKDLDIEELKRLGTYNEELARKHHRYNKMLVPGMIGCSWSHRNIYADIIEKKYRNALILEDDVEIDPTTIEFFPEIMKEVPDDWELLYLGYAGREEEKTFSFLKKIVYHLQRIIGAMKFSHRTIQNLYPKKIAEHVYKAGYHDQTHAYAISNSGAGTLRSLQEPISFIADNLLAYAATNELVKAFIVKPKLVNQLSQGNEKNVITYIHG